MISTLHKLAGIGQDIGHTSSSSINFNANLPVTIEVLKQIDALRYRLKIGRKELTTKSNQNLKVGQKYWANFFESKGGILTISNLYRQPQLFENEAYFLPISIEQLFERKSFSFNDFKAFLLKQLSNEQLSKELFKIYGYMLLALSKATIHIPLIHQGKKVMVQFQKQTDETLLIYLAFEHLGPLWGILSQTELHISAMYEKSFHYLQKESAKLGIITHLTLQKEIKPLFDLSDMVLDLKG
ncbi:hypothetical protein [Sulfurospirillum oryzae]|uniref:hypothetical protein n=1 Tax=Sulfurospirillum oryzae TaxID=2976535 RepID=UPI0021E96CB1|nr:hypothetical protein [Sulfurospirillum oryzae]